MKTPLYLGLTIVGWVYFVILPIAFYVYLAVRLHSWLLLLIIPLYLTLLKLMWKRHSAP